MGFFRVGMPGLFSRLGGLLYRAGVALYSSCFFLSFFLSSAPVLRVGVVGISVWVCKYGTRTVPRQKCS